MVRAEFPSIKPQAWPPEDLRLWNLAKQPVDLFEDGGVAADWSEAYIDNVERTYGQFLQYLASTGQLDRFVTPKERAQEPAIRAFLEAFAPDRADNTVARAIGGIAAVVRACHPPEGAPWLTKLARRLSKTAKPVRPKLPRTASIEELIWLAERLIAEGREILKCGKRAGAPLFRDGLIIATLVVHPIRRANLAALQLGKTMFADGDDITVHFNPDQTKNGVELNRAYPAWLVQHFREYLETVRPILMEAAEGRDEGWVWIGCCGTRLEDQTFRVITTNRTTKYLGRSVPPHNFRHSTVTDIARLEPDLIHIAPNVLGHRSAVTADQCYILADTFRAFSDHDALIERRRRRP